MDIILILTSIMLVGFMIGMTALVVSILVSAFVIAVSVRIIEAILE